MKVTCDTCNKQFKNDRGLTVHSRRMHSIKGAADVLARRQHESLSDVINRLRQELSGVRVKVDSCEAALDDVLSTIGL